MNRIIRTGFYIASFAGSHMLMAQKAPSLQELVETAIQKDHNLANKQLDIDASKIDQQKLREIYLPTLDLTGKYAFLYSGVNIKAPANSVPELGIALPAMDDAFTNRANLVTGGLKTEAVLYTGGKVPALKKALNEKVSAQTVMLEKDRQQIISDVSTAYDQLALLKQAKLVLDESKRRLQINSETADKALDYGLITKYEHQKIDVARTQLDSKIQQYEGKRKLLIELLHNYTGIENERLNQIDPDLRPALAALNGNSIENRPEIAALGHSINAYNHRIKAAQSWWKPKIAASASAGYLNLFDIQFKAREPFPTGNTLTLKTNKLELLPNFNVGIGFKWDLLDGNKGRREVQHARIELKKAENEKTEALEKLELNLVKSQTEYASAMAEIRAKETQKSAAENALAQATKEFKTGLIKSADLIGAENDYQAAALEYLQAVFSQRRTVIDLLRATGDLTTQSIR